MKPESRTRRHSAAEKKQSPSADSYVSALRPARSETLISVVLPVFNEVKALRPLAARVQKALEELGVRREIVFVNDGSTDESDRLLDQMAAQSPDIRVIH